MREPVARAQMLIHKGADEVFDAFARPDLLTQFWLHRSSGPLHAGAQVVWEFMVPGATEQVRVTAFDAPRQIGFDWLEGQLHVEISLADFAAGSTTVSVAVSGFAAGDDRVAQVVNATEGFSIVLCDLKTLLESGRSAHLVRDKAVLIQHRPGP